MPASQPRRRLLSVIISAYNSAGTLGEQLEALKAQVYDGDWEIIVVDNGSNDATVDLVREYQRIMPHLRLIDASEKQGKAYACNVAAPAAKGDAFIFCDADDVVAPGWLAALAEALGQHDLVAGAVEVHTLNQVTPPEPYVCTGSRERDGFLPYGMGCNLAMTREAFESVNGFSENFDRCQDVDLTWRLQLRGYRIHDVPEAVVHYRYLEELWPNWKVSVWIGEADVNLYRYFAAYGMPRSPIRAVLRKYMRLMMRIPRLWRAGRYIRLTWVREAANCWGRIRGSLRYRTLYL